jgi:cob(I)alamin adenosyltransferase
MIHKGLIHVYTGDGKGKTTAAIGLAVRTAGHDRKVLILQFLKGGAQNSGEIAALRKLGIKVITFKDQISPLFDPGADISKLKASVKESIELSIKEIKSGIYDLVVLDEFNNLLDSKLSDMDDIRRIIESKPESLEIVFTGRNAPDELVELADYATQILMTKHPFNSNIKARKGIEF